jgi:membrane associated rhomboid family serine protease
MNREDPSLDENLEPEPEDFLPAPPKKKGFLQQKPRLSSLNPALFFFVLFLLLSFVYWTYDVRDLMWASRDSVFVHKEYWRVLSSLFIHANPLHLMDNSLLFLIFGYFLFHFYRTLVFPVASFVVGILTTLTSIHFHEPQIHLLGASGMIYGMVAMWIVFYVKYDIRFSIPKRFLRASGFSLVLLFPTSFHMEIDYLAHAIGFGYGLIAGVLLIPFLNKRVEDFYLKNR